MAARMWSRVGLHVVRGMHTAAYFAACEHTSLWTPTVQETDGETVTDLSPSIAH